MEDPRTVEEAKAAAREPQAEPTTVQPVDEETTQPAEDQSFDEDEGEHDESRANYDTDEEGV